MQQGDILLVRQIIVSMVLIAGAQGCAVSGDLIVKRLPSDQSPKVLIGDTAIGPPLGYFALVKDGDRYCAVKFLETGDSKAPEGKYPNYRYSLYEWYYQGDGSGDFVRQTAKYGQDKATWKFVPFIGRFSFQTGNTGVDCGDIQLAWYGSTTLTFATARASETWEETLKRGIKVAPTKWTDIKEVNVFDKRLTWYAADSKRESRLVPVDSLY